MNFPQIVLVKTRENYFLAAVNSIRQKIIANFENNLPNNSLGLLLGIVFGIKQDLSKDFLANTKLVRVTHVIAASGMNVRMAGGFIFYIFYIFLKRQFAIIASIFGNFVLCISGWARRIYYQGFNYGNNRSFFPNSGKTAI